MAFYIVDTRDMCAQRVTPDAWEPDERRWQKVEADCFPEALAIALKRVGHPRADEAQRRADAYAALCSTKVP
jgi:hypothetical protein